MTLASPGEGPHFFTKLLQEYNGKVPFIVTDLISQLVNLKVEEIVGIFRLSGQKTIITKICQELDCGRIKSYDSYKEPNDIANALKKYIRELSLIDPIIGLDIYKEVDQAVEKYGDTDQIHKELNRILCHNGCESRKNTLAVLAKYFNEISKHSDVNRMDAKNLSIVFTPSLFPQSNSEPSSQSLTAVKIIIQDFDKIFLDPNMYSPNLVYMTDEDIENLSMPDVNDDYLLNEQIRRETRKDSLIQFDRTSLIDSLGISVPNRDPPSLPHSS